jgi:threonylcarbamoyladenosine tRNA methylthiotransferase MtaB
LTGIHIASYGKEFPDDSGIMALVESVSNISGIERIRIGSIEPTTLNAEFIRRAGAIKKLCPHFHVSLQSGCDATLKRMNRKYTAAEYYDAIEALRAGIPDVSVTTDVMTGFPGEDETEFIETYEFLKKIRFSKTHIFSYSPRKNTPAASYADQVPNDIKETRHGLLEKLNATNMRDFNSAFIGRVMPVLIESAVEKGKSTDVYEGMTGNYISVVFEGKGFVRGDIVPVRISSVRNDGLTGENTSCGNA